MGVDHEGLNHYSSTQLIPNESEYMEGLHNLHKKLLLSEKRESGAEESWDGSVASEVEGNDGAMTIERMRTALRAERKALAALYVELEEERNAAAIAANQTMAMITRLQEEKAAMQMEALQYQRMMEEQSEYDQEALQLLNELMMKREKEKQELEKELETYRNKVLDYEAKEKIMMVRKSRDFSASCSNEDDSDELSIDLNREATDKCCFLYRHQENCNNSGITTQSNNNADYLSSLEESFAEFEEERLLILEELKALEEKLSTLGDEDDDDDDEQLFEDVKPIEHVTDDYGSGFPENYSHELSSPEENEKNYSTNKIMGLAAKRLLPLFDAEELIEEEGKIGCKSEGMNKKVGIEEEVDHVYKRLQALEEDREFLKNCVGSIKKGDKGMSVLHQILQHLRDLKAAELCARNLIADGPLS